MGNYRFRLSDMIPNAWFYKLKDMGKLRHQNSIKNPTKKKHHHTSTSSSLSSSAAAMSSKSKQTHICHQRKSYYFTRDLTPAAPNHDTFCDNVATNTRTSEASDSHYSEQPRKSSKKKRSTRRNMASNRPIPSPRLISSSVTAGCSCRASLESIWTKPDSTPEEYPNSPLDTSPENEWAPPGFGANSGIASETFDGKLSWSASCGCRVDDDIIIEMENKALNASFEDSDKLNGFYTVSELDLPPVVTDASELCSKTGDSKERETHNEPTKLRRCTAKFEETKDCGSLSVKVVKEATSSTCPKEQKKTSPTRRFSANSAAGLKLRTNSPRIANRRIQGRKSISSCSGSSSRKSVSDSFAVVKSSNDPQRDFRESMVEMIVENNICASKDLEDLLACYLSLNSDEYHDLIIRVFKQIWFDIVDIRPK